MKKILICCSFLLLAASGIMAGGVLDLKDIVNGKFRGESLASVEPLSDGESYIQISSDGKQLQKFSFKTGKQTGILFDANTVRGSKVERVEGYIVSPDMKRILIQTQTKSIYRHSFTAVYYIFNIANNRLEPLSDGGPQQTPVWSPDGNQVAFVRDNNIFLVKLLYNNAESQVTKDGKRNEIINGIPDWVNEEEFSFNSSMVFSADSRQIVWVRYDESEVKEYSMSMFKGLQPERQEYATYPGFYTYKYPKPGEKNAQVKVMSYDIKSHQTRTMQVPLDADGYIPRIKATSDASKIAVFTLNRHQDCLRVFMVNPLSTVAQQVVEDRVDKYVNENVFANVKLTSSHLVLTSERDGFNHIYVYTLNGQRQRQMTEGVVTDVFGLDETTGDLYYAAFVGGPLNQKIYVNHKNGKTDCLTPKDGWNMAVFSSSLKNFICTWSDINHPTETSLYNNQGKVLASLKQNDALQQQYNSYAMGTKQLFDFQTSEGVKLYGWMVKPANFDPQKKYPVVMFQYGGPGSQQVKNSWNIGMSGQGAILEQYMAQQGYICVCVDNRGTGGRGAEFEKCTYLRLGELEAKDQVETALWLGSQSYVDKNRIAIWGWSYGGWNTLMSMSEGRPVFACGIAIAPPTCWRYYDTVYTERFMRTPNENASGYDEVNPIARASKLHGALLLVHGLADDNVHYQNTAEYVEALVQADKDFRQLVYTNRNHSIFGGNTRNHLFRQCMNFFNENLK
ncbi:S9 family peptidase [Xylanibacter brevis]|uniref:S9 family peptidase n=1 Tax=Xylanibacter brevis TaxID=83231 RepID=UPI0004802CAA|nr:S9 family peptidase [Xylanibacter brevis]